LDSRAVVSTTALFVLEPTMSSKPKKEKKKKSLRFLRRGGSQGFGGKPGRKGKRRMPKKAFFRKQT
jgi:hypothetical protein